MPVLEERTFQGGISDYEDKGTSGSFKKGKNLNIRKKIDSLSCNQALVDEGLLDYSLSPSSSLSPSASVSQSPSPSLTPSPSSSTSPSLSFSRSESASSGISPSPSLSPSISASASPSVTPSSSRSLSPSGSGALTSVFTDLILWFINATDGYTYAFGNTGNIYRRASGVWTRVYKDSHGKITGAIEKPDENGIAWLIWATTDGFLNRKRIPGQDDWNDVNEDLTSDIWPKGNLTPADWHTMAQIGGSAYIANKDRLALVGYDNSYTNEALDLIPGNIAKTLVERNGRAIIGTYKSSQPEKGINGAIDAEFPLAQIGEDGDIFFANGIDSIAFKRFPGGGKVNPDGVDAISKADFFEWEETALSWISKQEIKSIALFGVFGADTGTNGIYSIGRENKNKPFVMNLDYALEVDEIGAITILDDGTILASFRDGADFGVKATDPLTKAVAEYEGLDFRAPVKNPEKPTAWTMIELFHDPLPNGATLEVFYRVNKTGSFVRAVTADDQNVFDTTGEEKSTFKVGANGDIFERKIVLTPIGNLDPHVHRVRSYFL